MLIEAVLFDLDDTLYPEIEYCMGGFAAVARHLEPIVQAGAVEIVEVLRSIHVDEAREGVFDRAAKRIGFPEAIIPELVRIYRSHPPRLTLSTETKDLLGELRRQYRIGVVTDGHAAVQRAKIESLGLLELVDSIVVADEMGRSAWKPAPVALLECCRRLGVSPSAAVFVGDNPDRDMVAARAAGMPSIRIRPPFGYFSRLESPEDSSQAQIAGLMEISGVLENPRELERE